MHVVSRPGTWCASSQLKKPAKIVILPSWRPSYGSLKPGVVDRAFCWLRRHVANVQSRWNSLVATECAQIVIVVLSPGSKKVAIFVCAIVKLEGTVLGLVFVLIPPCMSHNNKDMECE
jgi:hypothetical protein